MLALGGVPETPPELETLSQLGPLTFENVLGGQPPDALALPETEAPTVPERSGALTDSAEHTLIEPPSVAVLPAESVTLTL